MMLQKIHISFEHVMKLKMAWWTEEPVHPPISSMPHCITEGIYLEDRTRTIHVGELRRAIHHDVAGGTSRGLPRVCNYHEPAIFRAVQMKMKAGLGMPKTSYDANFDHPTHIPKLRRPPISEKRMATIFLISGLRHPELMRLTTLGSELIHIVNWPATPLSGVVTDQIFFTSPLLAAIAKILANTHAVNNFRTQYSFVLSPPKQACTLGTLVHMW